VRTQTLREVERQHLRDKLGQDDKGIDIQYLKNVILKLYETGESAALLPVVGMMLRFSPAELKRCQEALARGPEPPADAAAVAGVGDASSVDLGLSSWTSWAFGGTEEVKESPR
jgi:hypothetical protein